MVQITIQIDGDKVTVNQSVASTKVEEKNKKFFIIMRESKYVEVFESSWVEFVSDDYIKAINHLRNYRWDNDNIYKLYIQNEDGTIIPCNGTDWDIDR